MIVVDASIAAKWFLNEIDSELARSFFGSGRNRCVAPDLLTIEVGRALVAAGNSRRMHVGAARRAVHIWLESVKHEGVTLYPLTAEQIQHAADIALDIGHPLADCLYLALAIELDCELATCDAEFQAIAAPLYPRVKLLADFS